MIVQTSDNGMIVIQPVIIFSRVPSWRPEDPAPNKRVEDDLRKAGMS
jgi:hypothetical protein